MRLNLAKGFKDTTLSELARITRLTSILAQLKPGTNTPEEKHFVDM